MAYLWSLNVWYRGQINIYTVGKLLVCSHKCLCSLIPKTYLPNSLSSILLSLLRKFSLVYFLVDDACYSLIPTLLKRLVLYRKTQSGAKKNVVRSSVSLSDARYNLAVTHAIVAVAVIDLTTHVKSLLTDVHTEWDRIGPPEPGVGHQWSLWILAIRSKSRCQSQGAASRSQLYSRIVGDSGSIMATNCWRCLHNGTIMPVGSFESGKLKFIFWTTLRLCLCS